MRLDPHYHEGLHLTEEQEVAWQADIAALQQHASSQELATLLMGDFFNELKARWGRKVGALALESGVSPLVAWKCARTALLIPPGHAIRKLSLPYSILRMIAHLPNPLAWAEIACDWREERRLSVREFAALLVDCGHRNQRVRHVKYCLHCERSITPGADANNVQIRHGETSGWLCGPRCVRAYFSDPGEPTGPPPSIGGLSSTEHESQSPSPTPAAMTSASQPASLHTVGNPESEIQNPKSEPAPAFTIAATEIRDTDPIPSSLVPSLPRCLTRSLAHSAPRPDTRLRVSPLPRRRHRDDKPLVALSRSHPPVIRFYGIRIPIDPSFSSVRAGGLRAVVAATSVARSQGTVIQSSRLPPSGKSVPPLAEITKDSCGGTPTVLYS